MANNPIYIGYAWTQAFDFPTGFFQAGDQIRAQFRYNEGDGELLASISDNNGTDIEGDRAFLTLSGAQTAGMNAGEVCTAIVIVRGGADIPIGQLITIPVVYLPTRAA